MFNFILGIAVGAAFAPFWIVIYNKGKEIIVSWMPPKPPAA
jgi:hypothetical protein